MVAILNIFTICSVIIFNTNAVPTSSVNKCADQNEWYCIEHLCGQFSSVQCSSAPGFVKQQYICNETICEPMVSTSIDSCCNLSNTYVHYPCNDSLDTRYFCDILGCDDVPDSDSIGKKMVMIIGCIIMAVMTGIMIIVFVFVFIVIYQTLYVYFSVRRSKQRKTKKMERIEDKILDS